MLLVILGAGASFDSVLAEDMRTPPAWQPPLSDRLLEPTLYNEYLNAFPAVRGIVGRIRQALRDSPPPVASLEYELRKVVDDAKVDPALNRALIAMRFYLQHVLGRCSEEWVTFHGGVTNHAWLVGHVEYWRMTHKQKAVYVTFNYDTILDQALQDHYGWDPARGGADLAGYISHPAFKLFKLHGSYNWVGRTGLPSPSDDGPAARQALIERAGQYGESDGPFRLLGIKSDHPNPRMFNFDDLIDRDTDRGRPMCCLPTLALPLVDKSSYVGPQTHQQALRSALPEVDRVISIGWRGAEQHFLSDLKAIRENAKFWVVTTSAEHSQRTIGTLKKAGVVADFEPIGSAGFSAFRQTSSDLQTLLGQGPV